MDERMYWYAILTIVEISGDFVFAMVLTLIICAVTAVRRQFLTCIEAVLVVIMTFVLNAAGKCAMVTLR